MIRNCIPVGTDLAAHPSPSAAKALEGTCSPLDGDAGNWRWKVDPAFPDSSQIVPSWASTILRATNNPSPDPFRPLPPELPLAKGSKIMVRSESGTPLPRSRMLTVTASLVAETETTTLVAGGE